MALSRLQDPDRELREQAAARDHRGAAAGPAHARVHVQHAAGRQGDQGPAARLPALARLAQPRQRGQRRVRGGADRGGRRALRAGAALVPAQGQAARPRPARLLGPDGAARATPRSGSPTTRRARSCSTATPGFSPELGEAAQGFFGERLHRRPAAAGQARRRVLLLHGALAPPLRDAQLHVAPARRAGDGPRAGPRRARLARPSAGHLPVHHPADAGRDGLDLRRDDRARAPAGARAGRRRAARPAGRVARRRRRRGVPPGGDESLRGRGAHGAARVRASCRPTASPSSGSETQARPARRRGRPARRLRPLVVLRPPLHRHARVRLRVRLRAPARAVGLPPLRAGRRGVRRPRTWTCCAPAARGRPRSSGRSSAWTSRTPASGAPAST